MVRRAAALFVTVAAYIGCTGFGADTGGNTGDDGGLGSDTSISDGPLDDGGSRPHMLYVFGGGAGNWGLGYVGDASIDEVIAAPILEGGKLGAWTTRPPLPRPTIHSNPAVVTTHFATIVGEFGTPTSGGQPNVIFSDLDGPATWTQTTPLDKGAGGWDTAYGVATDGSRIFVVGADPNDRKRVRQTTVLAGGGVAPWQDATALTFALDSVSAVVHGGFLYAYGHMNPGDGGAAYLGMAYARVTSSGLDPWIASSTNSPSSVFFGVAALGKTLFVVGGSNVNNGATPDVRVATIQSDGSAGPLTPSAPLPEARTNACVVAGPNAIYVIGGEPGGGSNSAYDSVFVAVPDPEGNIGSWQTSAPLPSPRAGAACVVY